MAQQLFQIGVKGLVRNGLGEILMVQVPEWNNNPDHWDLPGGRMDPGEDFLQTLQRELKEELGSTYVDQPKQLMAMLTKITIPDGELRIPLIYVVYEVKLPSGTEISLDPKGAEQEFRWFSPLEAAKVMTVKFPVNFCDLVKNL